MIVLPKHKLCIVTPPHTASRHLHDALCNDKIGGIRVVGLNPGNIIDHHFTRSCSEYSDYKRYLVVRNPFDRATGLFRHYQWACAAMPETIKVHGLSWYDFACSLAVDDFGRLDWLFRYTITRLIQDTHYDGIIHFECLENRIRELLGKDISLPSRYEDSPKEYLSYYEDEQIVSWILTWAYPDLWRYYSAFVPIIEKKKFSDE